MPTTFYRYHDYPTEGGGCHVVEETFDLVKETPCGYWINDNWSFPQRFEGDNRWVSKTARKRFAYPTREEALVSFIARKRQQIRYMKIKARRAEQAFEKGKYMLAELKEEG